MTPNFFNSLVAKLEELGAVVVVVVVVVVDIVVVIFAVFGGGGFIIKFNESLGPWHVYTPWSLSSLMANFVRLLLYRNVYTLLYNV